MGVQVFLNMQQLHEGSFGLPNIIQPVRADYSNSFKFCVSTHMWLKQLILMMWRIL